MNSSPEERALADCPLEEASHRQEVKVSRGGVDRVDLCEDETPATPAAWLPLEPFTPRPCSPLWPESSAFGAL